MWHKDKLCNACKYCGAVVIVETLRGRRDVAEEEEEYGLTLKHSALKKHHLEPEVREKAPQLQLT